MGVKVITSVAQSLTSEASSHAKSLEPPRSGEIGDTQSLLMSRSITPAWATVREVRASVRELLLEFPAEFNHAATMVSSELLENAIKYGEGVAAAPMIEFHLGLLERQLQVKVINGSTDSVGVDELMLHVRLLRESSDKEALYQARIEELMTNSCTSTRLGIFRIAHEGRFNINCTYIDEVVTVTATRSLP